MKPDAHSVFSRVLNEAIAALPEKTPDAREQVYRKVRLFLVTSRHAHMGRQLEEAIAEMEATFTDPASDAGQGVTVTTETRGRRLSNFSSTFRHRVSPKVLGAGIAAALALSAAGFYVYQSPAPDPEFDRGTSAYSDNTQSFSPISSWSSYYAAVVEGDQRYVQVNGTAPLYAIATVDIDPSTSYEVTARVRVIKDDPASGGSVFSIGVKPYGDLGSADSYVFHDFASSAERVVLTSSQGWVTITGVLSGLGETPGLFHPGTRYVRAAALMNQSSPNAVAQIDFLRIRQLPK